MSDPLRDSRFPNRPQHPDYWRLADVLNYLDGETTEGGKGLPEIVEGVIDLNSLTYAAGMRSLKARQLLDLPRGSEAALASMFVNGFLAGIRFEKEGGHR
jgi:hypothetical protein